MSMSWWHVPLVETPGTVHLYGAQGAVYVYGYTGWGALNQGQSMRQCITPAVPRYDVIASQRPYNTPWISHQATGSFTKTIWKYLDTLSYLIAGIWHFYTVFFIKGFFYKNRQPYNLILPSANVGDPTREIIWEHYLRWGHFHICWLTTSKIRIARGSC